MESSKQSPWTRHFDAIADELVRLVAICDVQLREPQAIDRILKSDVTVCGKQNPVAFRKLRDLLAATYNSLNKSIDRLGSEETKAITDEIIARIDKRKGNISDAIK